MTFAIPREILLLEQAAGLDSTTARALRHIEEAQRIQDIIDKANGVSKFMQQYETIRAHARSALNEGIERIRKQMEEIDRLRRQMQVLKVSTHTIRHGQSGSPSNGKKSAAKKSAKSASGGGGGGDGGGDGDGDGPGPKHTRTKSKKSRSSKSVTIRPSRLPTSSPGKTASTPSPQVLTHRPQPSRGIAIVAMILLFGIALTAPSSSIVGLVVVCLLVIALAGMGHPEVAKDVWRSVPKLLKQSASTDEESESPDEES